MAEHNEPGCSHQSASDSLVSDTLTSFTTVSSDREDLGGDALENSSRTSTSVTSCDTLLLFLNLLIM